MLDIEGEACYYAAENGESLLASLRFVRSYMKYRDTNGTPHAGGMTIPQFYRFHTDVKSAFSESIRAPHPRRIGIVPTNIVRGEN